MKLGVRRCLQAIILTVAVSVAFVAQPVGDAHPVVGVAMAILLAFGALAVYVVVDVRSRPGVWAKVQEALKDEGAQPVR